MCALVGAAAFVSTTERAPLFAGVFTWELAHPQLVLLVVLVAVAIAVRYVRFDRLVPGARMSPRDARAGVPADPAGQ
ncbi:chloride channel protein [Tsukamurella soli]|uniref:chloride channel protein n=1 Tax=Tsukamurella soli TaxID=644556 RepID=UPI0036173489